MKKLIVFILFLTFNISFSQTANEVKTSLFWLEDNDLFYSANDDAFMQEPGLVPFDVKSDSISINNYLSGYYIYTQPVKYDKRTISLDDILRNDDLITAFKKSKRNQTIEFNNYWKYSLCIVTYEQIFLGYTDTQIPIFSSSDNNPNKLEYATRKIPNYFIKLINIVPYDS